MKAVLFVAGLLVATPSVAVQEPSLDDLLDKAGRYVRRDAHHEDVITDQIICQTTYSNYRRFETAARLIDPK